jgi:tetratricopeptide (TPR) repeat protein
MKKIILLITFFISFNLSSQSDLCVVKTENIFENIINNIANNLPAPPDLEIVNSTKRAAYISDGIIYIEKRLIKLFCRENDFESKIAYILSHELAHHYSNHGWASNTGFTYYTSAGQSIDENTDFNSERLLRKKDESQADLFGGFFSQISGYNALSVGEETLITIYDKYKIRDSRSYPTLQERIDIVNFNIKKSIDLAEIFHFGNMSLLSGNLKEANECFKEIIKNNFVSREIYNNLGLSYLLNGIQNSPELANYSYPIEIEASTRAKIKKTRSSFLDSSLENIKKAITYFKKANNLDEDFEPAKVNLMVSDFLVSQIQKKLDKVYYESLEKYSIKDSKKVNDIRVLFHLFNENKRKANKIAKDASIISDFNLNYNNLNSSEGFLPSYIDKKANFDSYILFLDKVNFSTSESSSSKIQIRKKSDDKLTVYEYNGVVYFIEITDTLYLNSINKINIKFDNIFLVGNNVFRVSNLNKSVFKYIDGELISIIKFK